eukprot:tig00000475_g1251.t1
MFVTLVPAITETRSASPIFVVASSQVKTPPPKIVTVEPEAFPRVFPAPQPAKHAWPASAWSPSRLCSLANALALESDYPHETQWEAAIWAPGRIADKIQHMAMSSPTFTHERKMMDHPENGTWPSAIWAPKRSRRAVHTH